MGVFTKVVLPLDSRGLYSAALIFGGVAGALLEKSEGWAFRLQTSSWVQGHLSSGQASALSLILTILAAVLPAIVIGALIACLTRRWRPIMVAAALAGFAELFFSLFVHSVLLSNAGGTDWQGWPLFGFLFNVAVLTVLSVGAACTTAALVRALFTIIEQDGAHCSRCGYELGSAAISTCPECGSSADAAQLSFRRLHCTAAWLFRRSRLIGAVIIAVVLVQGAWTVYYRTIPALRFISQFPRYSVPLRGEMTPHDEPALGMLPQCMAAWVAIPGDNTRGLAVLYVADKRSPLVAMRLAISAVPARPTMTYQAFFDFGTPQVACDLPRDLAERVVREGIPESLLRKLLAEADAAKWVPSVPGPPFSAGSSTRWIDPAPHFPAKR